MLRCLETWDYGTSQALGLTFNKIINRAPQGSPHTHTYSSAFYASYVQIFIVKDEMRTCVYCINWRTNPLLTLNYTV